MNSYISKRKHEQPRSKLEFILPIPVTIMPDEILYTSNDLVKGIFINIMSEISDVWDTVCLFNDIFMSYLIPKPSLSKNNSDKREKGVHAFPKGINPKGNIIPLPEFKFTMMSESRTLATILQELPPICCL